MCTSIAFNGASGALYFGRNLDWESGFGEVPVFAPRNWNCTWAFNGDLSRNDTPAATQGSQAASAHADAPHAVLGIGIAAQNTPLYFDCMNEAGLTMGGLLFAGFAQYESEPVDGKINVASYEFPLWVTRNFSTVDQVLEVLSKVAIIGAPVAGMDPTPLHWMIADKNRCIVAEYTKHGMQIHNNPVNVLANQPTFDWHLENLRSYYMVSPDVPQAAQWGNTTLDAYGTGAGMRALPGDYYSTSRFVRAAYLNAHYPAVASEQENVTRLFRTLQGVSMIEGASRMKNGNFEKTIYTSGYSTETGSCYYATYSDFALKQCALGDFDAEGTELVTVEF